jgi:hypothetical protein
MHPTLLRLDRLAAHLSSDDEVVAVLGLGSAGRDHHRFDEHSDIDFFVVVSSADTKRRFLADVGWLDGLGSPLAASYENDPNGRKALLADGLFLEYAVFTPAELATLALDGVRVVWVRPGSESRLAWLPPPSRRTAFDTVDFHLSEALTNLYVGLHREARGERLTAMRFIQVYAVDRVLSLAQLHVDGSAPAAGSSADPFEPTRRAEQRHDPAELPLAEMVPGYDRNRDAAAVVLSWLTTRFAPDPVMIEAIEALLGALQPAPSPQPAA